MNIGTYLYTWLKGSLVGTDQFGNRYYRERGKPVRGVPRRWVMYHGEVEASRVPPEWHAWLHHTIAEPPTGSGAPKRAWQREHQPNLTGTEAAYRPPGHEFEGGHRARATGDYEPWRPS